MCVQNLNFVALPVPEIIGGKQKIWTVNPGYTNTPFSPKFLMGFCSDGQYNTIQYKANLYSAVSRKRIGGA